MPEITPVCDVCKKPANQKCSGCLSVFYCNKEHQKEAWKAHKKICKPFKVMKDGELGRYLIATRDIMEGEVILCEPPLIYGPSQYTVAVCVGCGRVLREDNARPCTKCGWPVCSIICEQAPCHIPECRYTVQRGNRVMITNYEIVHPLYQCLTVLRCLYQKQFLPEVWKKLSTLESHHDERKRTKAYDTERITIAQVILQFFKLSNVFTEEDIMKTVGILKVNGHEVPLEEAPHVAIYRTVTMLEHSCSANSWKSFSNKGEVVIIAGRNITKGEHVSICYTDPLWSTPNRRHHLYETKFFWCRCERCRDVTEFSTYFSAIKCQNESCSGYLLPPTFIEDTTNERLSNWHCTKCHSSVPCDSVQDIVDRLGQDLADMEKGSLDACLSYIRESEEYLPPNNHYLTEVRLVMAQMIGAEVNGNLRRLPDKELELKVQNCRHVMKLVDKLVPGEKRIIGVLLFSLQAALSEVGNRKSNKKEARQIYTEAKSYLTEALKILKHLSVISAEGKLRMKALFDLRSLEEALGK